MRCRCSIPDSLPAHVEILITIFAGLGLFFTGIRLIGHNLKQMTGRRLRALVGKAVADNRSATLYGLAAGAVMQSVNAVIFLLSTLVSTGVITTRQALPLINWANLGTSMIVLVAAVNLHLAVLMMVGLTGVAYYLRLDQSARYRHLVGLLLGLGLLFLGIDFIKTGAAPLKYAAWMQDLLKPTAQSVSLGFLLGVAVTLVAQSSSTVSVVAMTLAAAGVLDVAHGSAVVMGAGLASGISAWLLGHNLPGSARQLVVYQLILKTSGVAAFSALLMLEVFTGWPMLLAAFRALGLSPAMALAAVYVLLQIISDLAVHPFHHAIEHFLAHRHPPTDEEVLGKPHFLTDQGLAEPETALTLVDCEHHRLLQDLPRFVDPLRADGPDAAYTAEVLLSAGTAVARECDHFITALADQHRSRDVLERTIVLRERNDLIMGLQETVHDFHMAAATPNPPEPVRDLLHSLTESLHLILELLADTHNNPDSDDLDMLRTLTQDRSDMMDSVRKRLLSLGESLPTTHQQTVFACTTLFERAVWLVRRHVLSLGVLTPASS
jgi:phosphate:Na+ symporter